MSKCLTRVIDLGQIAALMMVNKCVKFKDNSFNSLEVMCKVEVFNDDAAAFAAAAASDDDNDTRVMMTIPRLVFR